MACVASGMSHTSGDVTLDMRTGILKNRAADWTLPEQSTEKFSSP